MGSEVEIVSGLGLGLVEITGLGAGSKLDTGMRSAEGSDKVIGVESGVGLGVRLIFKACFRGRPLRRGKMGTGLELGVGVESWLVVGMASKVGVASDVGVASEAGSDVDRKSLSIGPDVVFGDCANAGDFERSGLSRRGFQSSPESRFSSHSSSSLSESLISSLSSSRSLSRGLVGAGLGLGADMGSVVDTEINASSVVVGSEVGT